jgi:hypothetical protein
MLAIVALASIAGCGTSHRGSTSPGASASSAANAGEHPCTARSSDALRRLTGARAIDATVTLREPGMGTCRYVAHRQGRAVAVLAITVERDAAAFGRFSRAVVESQQNALWSHSASQDVRQVHGVGLDADWIPGSERLLATDGARFVTVELARSPRAHPTPAALAEGLARANLGPPHQPAIAEPGAP